MSAPTHCLCAQRLLMRILSSPLLIAATQMMPVAKHHVALPSTPASSLTNCAVNFRILDPSLSVGVGAGALYILITCKEEMKKLNKTMGETENLVQELKQQLELNREDLLSHHVHFDNTSCPNQSSHTGNQQPLCSKACKVDDVSDENVSSMQRLGKDHMAALAAELEAELDLMELNIKTEESHSFETCIYDREDEMVSCEGLDGVHTQVLSKGISNSNYSCTSSHGMLGASDPEGPKVHSKTSCANLGVSAVELDHRLRELLKVQQQERILELEELLEETKARLSVKEYEVLCWKNHVGSLKNLFHFRSNAGGTHVHSPNELNDEDSVAVYDKFVPELDQGADIFRSIQDPMVATKVKYVDTPISSNIPGVICLENAANLHRSSPSDKRYVPNEATISASRNSRDSMKAADDLNCREKFEETGMDTPEYAIMREMDTHTAEENAEVCQDKACSLHVRRNTDDPCLAAEISKLQHLEFKVDINRGHAFGIERVSAKTAAEVHESHPDSGRMNTDKSSISSKEELYQDTDVKYVVNSIMPRPLLLGKYHKNSFEESMPVPKIRTPSPNKKSITKTNERSMGSTSPVLHKIRHYEALGAHVSEKRV